MPSFPIPIVGGTYTHRSLPLSAQRTVNWYPELAPEGKVIHSLMPTPGARMFSDGASSGADRGMFNWNGVLYKVSGSEIYRVDSIGEQTSIGVIRGSGRCSFAGNSATLIVVSGGFVHSTDGLTVTDESDVDFEAPETVALLNEQAIYDGADGRFAVSDAGLLATINSLNYASAESGGDDLVAVYAHNQIVYMFGTHTIEPWWNSGNGSPPFDRVEGGISQVGLVARWSIASNVNAVYFLGDSKNVYRVAGGQVQRITESHPLSTEIQGYTVVDDAIGMCFTWHGQNFYMLSFPSEGASHCFHELSGQWFEMSSRGGAHFATSYAYAYGKHLVASSEDVLEWDFGVYDDNGSMIERIRDSRVIDGGLFGAPGKPLFMGALEIILNSGVGLLSGQGSDPEIMLQYSDDGGRSWSSYIHGKVGALGDYNYRVIFGPLGKFYSRVLRISATDPIPWEIYSATAELEVGI